MENSVTYCLTSVINIYVYMYILYMISQYIYIYIYIYKVSPTNWKSNCRRNKLVLYLKFGKDNTLGTQLCKLKSKTDIMHSKEVIYMEECSNCFMKYIRETCQTWKERDILHKSDIKTEKKEVQFTLTSATIKDMKLTGRTRQSLTKKTIIVSLKEE